MRPIELTPRLLALARQVPEGARFADVGTDHARLPVWLLERGIIQNAIASDLREGPLEQARETARRHALTERLSFRLGDGLTPIRGEEADVCAIAGMGGETIAAILTACPWAATPGHTFLLQPMTSVEELRAWLWRNGFRITREELVGEGRTIYVVITVIPGAMVPLTPAEEWAGRQYRGMESPLRAEYLARLCGRMAGMVDGLRRSTRPEDLEKLPRLEEALAGLNEMKKEWDRWQR